MLKHTLTTSDYFLIIVNLVPLYAVWFSGWNAGQVFLVYCLESVIIGLFQLVKLLILTQTKKTDYWNAGTPNETKQSGYLFVFFFLVHYGFFICIQLFLFLHITAIQKTIGEDVGVFQFLFHFPRYMQQSSLWLLLLFTASYALLTVKDFILTGAYKIADMNVIMFQPYMRIFVQQFTVILGSLFLGFGAGKIFMLVFVTAKIFFEILIPFDEMIGKAARKKIKNDN